MNIAAKKSLVHESESQRQYARIKIPARLIMEVNGTLKKLQLLDLSAGGFAFQHNDSIPSKDNCRGRLEFNIDGFVFIMPIHFDIKLIEGGRIGCSFQGMSNQEASSLRHIITAYLGGELVTAGDMISILGRDNFAKSRAKKSSKALEGFAKLKAIVGSLLFFCIGLAAFSFVAFKLWTVLFVVHSSVAVVSSDTLTVSTPREGVITALVEKGQKVTSGQIIGTFSSPVVSFLSENSGSSSLDSELVQSFVNNSYLGSLISPCDCVVGAVHSINGEYVGKGGAIFDLISDDTAPFITARFSAENIEHLNIGKEVKISSGDKSINGVIDSIFIGKGNEGQLLDAVSVLVKSDSSFLTEMIGLPAKVSLLKYEL